MTPAPEFLDFIEGFPDHAEHPLDPYYDTPRCRTLRRVMHDYGGVVELSHLIGVDCEAIGEWCSGRSLPPMPVYLKALDMVAGGPLLHA